MRSYRHQVAKLLLAATVLCLFRIGDSASAADKADVFFALQDAIAAAKVTGEGTADNSSLNAIYQKANALEDLFKTAELPDQYAKSLEFDAKIIRSISAESRDESLAVVSDDLDLKLRFAHATLGWTNKSASLIGVSVTTKRGGDEVSNYIVYANPKLFRDQEPMFPFNNPSSPTSATMPPGLYVFVALKNGKVVSQQDESIGLAGQPNEDIILLVGE